MCNAEIVTLAGIGKQLLIEQGKEDERENARANAAANLLTSQYRETVEMRNVALHEDAEIQKITASAGQSRVVGAGAGVNIAVMSSVWKAATVDLYGQSEMRRKQIAAEGNIREHGINMKMEQLMDKYAKADGVEWGLVLANSFAQGVAYDRKVHGADYDGEIFGMKIPEWMGGNRPTEPKKNEVSAATFNSFLGY